MNCQVSTTDVPTIFNFHRHTDKSLPFIKGAQNKNVLGLQLYYKGFTNDLLKKLY